MCPKTQILGLNLMRGSQMARKKSSPKLKPATGRPNDKFPKIDPVTLVQEINMKFGDAGPIIRAANEAWDASDLRRTCGITSLDLATGGGLVAGRVHQFDGMESTGKNYLLYRYFAEIQRRYKEDSCLAMCCFESFVDKHFAQMCGCKIAMSKYDIEVTNTARAARGEPPLTKKEEWAALECPGVGEFHILKGPSEKVLEGIVHAVKSNVYQMIGIDSWDTMLTAPEEESVLGETPQIAAQATLQTRWAKKIEDAFNPKFRCDKCGFAPLKKKVTNYKLRYFKYECPECNWKGDKPYTEINETTIYCIKQVRAKIQMSGMKTMGRPYKSSGAYSLQHLNAIRVSLYPGAPIKIGKEKIGKEINWEITKAKTNAKEGATGSFILYFNPLEVDTTNDLLAQCLINEIIIQEEGGYYSAPSIGMDRIHGKDNVVDEIETDHILGDDLRKLLYNKLELAHVRFI